MEIKEKTIKEPMFNTFLSSYIGRCYSVCNKDLICNFDICNYLHAMQTV